MRDGVLMFDHFRLGRSLNLTTATRDPQMSRWDTSASRLECHKKRGWIEPIDQVVNALL